MFGNTFGPTAFDLKFRLFGVAARVHPSFWLGGLIFAQNSGPLLFVLASIATLFVSILVHEMGHALSGKFFNDRNPAIVLHMMGGHYQPGNALRCGRFVWMILWGPLAGFILGGIAIAAEVAYVAKLIPQSHILGMVLLDAMWINIVWGIVNLLPVFPLDGGQILREVIRWKFPKKDDAFAFTLSMIAAIIVAGLMFAAHSILKIFSLYPAILFAMLAFQNYQLRAQALALRQYGRYEPDEPLQPWERDPDWWKKK